MKIKSTAYILLLTVVLALTGCVRNDGDIGNLFGNWVIEEIYIGNAEDKDYTNPVQVNFQGNLFSMGETSETEVHNPPVIGTWSETGNEITLDISGNAGSKKEFPKSLHLGKGRSVTFTIEERKHNSMTWRLVMYGGPSFRYTLRKLL